MSAVDDPSIRPSRPSQRAERKDVGTIPPITTYEVAEYGTNYGAHGIRKTKFLLA